MIVIANVKTWIGDPAHPLGLNPRYAAEGAAYWQEIATHYAAMGCRPMAYLPHGSKPGERMASNLAAIDPALGCALGVVNHRLRRDYPDKPPLAYVGFAQDETPADVAMPAWKFPRRVSWSDRERLSDQYESAGLLGFDLILDGIGGDRAVKAEDAEAWAEFIEKRARLKPGAVGGEAFLSDGWVGPVGLGDPGNGGVSDRPLLSIRHDLMAKSGRVWMALLQSWVERYGVRGDGGGNLYAMLGGAWLRNWGKPRADFTPPWHEWWSDRGADELIERCRAAGFSRVVIDVWDRKPATEAFVRRFMDAA